MSYCSALIWSSSSSIIFEAEKLSTFPQKLDPSFENTLILLASLLFIIIKRFFQICWFPFLKVKILRDAIQLFTRIAIIRENEFPSLIQVFSSDDNGKKESCRENQGKNRKDKYSNNPFFIVHIFQISWILAKSYHKVLLRHLPL